MNDHTGGLGVDYAVEASGHPDALHHCLSATRQGGTISVVGIYERPIEKLDIGMAVVKKVMAGDGGELTDLSLNESSYGASPLALEAALARSHSLNRYPDPASAALRAAIGETHGLDPGRIVCGNGSEELIDLLARIYARPGDEILYTEYGFMQFPIVTMRVGATAVVAPEVSLRTDVDALIARLGERTTSSTTMIDGFKRKTRRSHRVACCGRLSLSAAGRTGISANA